MNDKLNLDPNALQVLWDLGLYYLVYEADSVEFTCAFKTVEEAFDWMEPDLEMDRNRRCARVVASGPGVHLEFPTHDQESRVIYWDKCPVQGCDAQPDDFFVDL